MKTKLSIRTRNFKFKTTDYTQALAFFLHYIPSLGKKYDVEISEAKDERIRSIFVRMADMLRPITPNSEKKKSVEKKLKKSGNKVASLNSPVRSRVIKKLWSEREIRQVCLYCKNNKTLSKIKGLSAYKSLARRHGDSGISQLCWAIKNNRLDKYSEKIKSVVKSSK